MTKRMTAVFLAVFMMLSLTSVNAEPVQENTEESIKENIEENAEVFAAAAVTVQAGGNTESFSSFTSAMAKAITYPEAVVKLQSDCSVTTSDYKSLISGKLTLDLAGHTLNMSSENQNFSINGTLTVKDSSSGGTIIFNKSRYDYFTVNGGGTMNVESGTIISKVYDIIIENQGTLNIKGGTIEYQGNPHYNNYVIWNTNGTVNISGGTVKTHYVGGVIRSRGLQGGLPKVNVSGGNIQGGSFIKCTYGTHEINITGGNIKLENNVLIDDDAEKITAVFGNADGTGPNIWTNGYMGSWAKSKRFIDVKGGVYLINPEVEGTFIGISTADCITGGIFEGVFESESNASLHISSIKKGCEFVRGTWENNQFSFDENGSFSMVSVYKAENTAAVIKPDGSEQVYDTLHDAIAAAQDMGGTADNPVKVRLNKNTEYGLGGESASPIIVKKGAVELDLNSKMIKAGENQVFVVEGGAHFTVIGSNSTSDRGIICAAPEAIKVVNGTMRMNAHMTYTGTGTAFVVEKNGKAYISSQMTSDKQGSVIVKNGGYLEINDALLENKSGTAVENLSCGTMKIGQLNPVLNNIKGNPAIDNKGRAEILSAINMKSYGGPALKASGAESHTVIGSKDIYANGQTDIIIYADHSSAVELTDIGSFIVYQVDISNWSTYPNIKDTNGQSTDKIKLRGGMYTSDFSAKDPVLNNIAYIDDGYTRTFKTEGTVIIPTDDCLEIGFYLREGRWDEPVVKNKYYYEDMQYLTVSLFDEFIPGIQFENGLRRLSFDLDDYDIQIKYYYMCTQYKDGRTEHSFVTEGTRLNLTGEEKSITFYPVWTKETMGRIFGFAEFLNNGTPAYAEVYDGDKLVCKTEILPVKDGAGDQLIDGNKIRRNFCTGHIDSSITTKSEYTLVISQKGTIPCTVENIVVSDGVVWWLRPEKIASVIPGDVNCDGAVNEQDVSAVRKPENINKNTEAAADYTADVNCDGVVNEQDVSDIRKPQHINKNANNNRYIGVPGASAK